MRQQFRRAFPFHSGQQYGKQAPDDAAFAVAEEVQLLAGDAHPQPDAGAVYPAGSAVDIYLPTAGAGRRSVLRSLL
ncbi:hypothetical protein L1887_46755 [Cichorium endivia]|nr:hypothetical protein L1887_46755 [Cichorium endivia]